MTSNSSQSIDKLKDTGQDTLKALREKAVNTVSDKVSGLTDKLEGVSNGGPVGKAVAKGGEAAAKGDNPVMGAAKGAASSVKDAITGGGGGGGGGDKATKAINIIEEIDVGVPIRVAYNQWTQYEDFPSFTKKIENAEMEDGEEEVKVNFKTQIFLSHRSWEAKIKQQKPDEIIVWTSTGEKGHVDGAVSFHELGPNLTRILVVLEYYPQGFFEWMGNRWRAQGRRARLEIKNFRRHVMTRTILNPDDVEGWRGTVEDGEVVKTHDEALEEEEQEQEQDSESDEYEDDETSGDDDEEGDEESEEEDEDEGDEADDESEEEGDAEEDDDEEEQQPRRRRRAS